MTLTPVAGPVNQPINRSTTLTDRPTPILHSPPPLTSHPPATYFPYQRCSTSAGRCTSSPTLSRSSRRPACSTPTRFVVSYIFLALLVLSASLVCACLPSWWVVFVRGRTHIDQCVPPPQKHTHTPQRYPFDFPTVDKPYETYTGLNVRLRYFLRVTVTTKSAYVPNLVAEQDLLVQTTTEVCMWGVLFGVDFGCMWGRAG